MATPGLNLQARGLDAGRTPDAATPDMNIEGQNELASGLDHPGSAVP